MPIRTMIVLGRITVPRDTEEVGGTTIVWVLTPMVYIGQVPTLMRVAEKTVWTMPHGNLFIFPCLKQK